tara:strand:- start:2633 stop:3121 length:489 start_codon:yes stop_codon:yes gene_type:complete
MKKIISLFLIVMVGACSELDFVYKDSKNIINPLYGKTKVDTSGVDLAFLNSYTPMLFGKNKEPIFSLLINIKEKKTKRSVETNQAISNIRYELRFVYTLTFNKKNCVTYKKEILSNFSIIPKSAGFNYGTDASLEKKYELVTSDNLNEFISFLSDVEIEDCL